LGFGGISLAPEFLLDGNGTASPANKGLFIEDLVRLNFTGGFELSNLVLRGLRIPKLEEVEVPRVSQFRLQPNPIFTVEDTGLKFFDLSPIGLIELNLKNGCVDCAFSISVMNSLSNVTLPWLTGVTEFANIGNLETDGRPAINVSMDSLKTVKSAAFSGLSVLSLQNLCPIASQSPIALNFLRYLLAVWRPLVGNFRWKGFRISRRFLPRPFVRWQETLR
jgi:hypothetical protein